MNGEMAHLDKVAIFLAKFILVSYFAVGLGPLYFESGQETQHNGMTEIALPMLVQLTSDFAEIVFLSGGSQGLCVFDASKYQQGYEYYRMWDAIDCRIGYYLGIQLLYNVSDFIRSASGTTSADVGTSTNFSAENNSAAIDAIRSASNPSFFSVMFGLFMAGNIIIVLCGLVFVIVFSSIILYFLTSYLVCTVTLYVMAYISPIFIPMVLFEPTKAYFDSWLKVTLSCALQPAVIGGFLAFILTMYDGAIYGNCEFQRYDYTFSGVNFSTFELRLPDNEPEKCSGSAGYKLMKYYMGEGWQKEFVIIFVIRTIQDVLDLGTNMIYVLIFTFIFYYFVKSVNEFASDLTSGASIAAVTSSPTRLIDMARKAASYTKKAAGNMGGNKAKLGKGIGGKDKGSGAEGGAKDKARGGGAASATDKLSGGMKGGGK
jgi:type IV secretion system protein VirB6